LLKRWSLIDGNNLKDRRLKIEKVQNAIQKNIKKAKKDTLLKDLLTNSMVPRKNGCLTKNLILKNVK